MTTVFSKIIAGEIPHYKVYEDDVVYAFLDAHPVNRGHTLVIPKEEYRDIYETPDEILSHLITVVKKLSIAVKKTVGADGINIHVNNESGAGQEVFHLHFHVIPRFEGDGFEHWHGNVVESEEEKTSLAEKIGGNI